MLCRRCSSHTVLHTSVEHFVQLVNAIPLNRKKCALTIERATICGRSFFLLLLVEQHSIFSGVTINELNCELLMKDIRFLCGVPINLMEFSVIIWRKPAENSYFCAEKKVVKRLLSTKKGERERERVWVCDVIKKNGGKQLIISVCCTYSVFVTHAKGVFMLSFKNKCSWLSIVPSNARYDSVNKDKKNSTYFTKQNRILNNNKKHEASKTTQKRKIKWQIRIKEIIVWNAMQTMVI